MYLDFRKVPDVVTLSYCVGKSHALYNYIYCKIQKKHIRLKIFKMEAKNTILLIQDKHESFELRRSVSGTSGVLNLIQVTDPLRPTIFLLTINKRIPIQFTYFFILFSAYFHHNHEK